MSISVKNIASVLFLLNKIGSLLLKFVLIALGIGILSIPVFLCYFYEWQEQFVTKFTVDYLGIILSSLSLVIVGATVWIQHKQLKELSTSNNANFVIAKNTYNALVLQLIGDFLSPEMAETRRCTETLREELKSDQQGIVRANLKQLFIMQISDDWKRGGQEYQELMKTDIFKQFAAFTKLARFFDMISYYELDEQTASAIRFYYTWWRGFFLTVREIFKEAAAECPHPYLSIFPNWYDLVERFDENLEKADKDRKEF